MNRTPSKGLALTYLVRLSIASPSGGRSEIENLNVIKKIREGFDDFPYASAQAMKRALRDTMRGLGYGPLSPVIKSKPATTLGDPVQYIDDDLFGYMKAATKKSGNTEVDTFNGTRKAVVSMVPLLALSRFQDGVDFGANMMALRAGGNPMPYETEVHRGWYRISLYVDLNGIGSGMGFVERVEAVREKLTSQDLFTITEAYDFLEKMKTDKTTRAKSQGQQPAAPGDDNDNVGGDDDKDDGDQGKGFYAAKRLCYVSMPPETRYSRAKAVLDAVRFLSPSGRSSNWLIDLTPKLLVAAYVKGARTPFLEASLLDDDGKIKTDTIDTIKATFADGIENMVVGYRKDFFKLSNDNTATADNVAYQEMHQAFATVDGWLKAHFKVTDKSQAADPRG